MSKTLEEAVNQQMKLDDTDLPKDWRTQSLNNEFEYKSVDGTDFDAFNKETGEVCEHNFVWKGDGLVLICTICFIDGT